MFYTLPSLILFMLITILIFFMLHQPSILTLLFILEAATLSALTAMFMFSWATVCLNPCLMFIFITFSACGASLGLAVLVANVRFWGNDTFKMNSSLLC